MPLAMFSMFHESGDREVQEIDMQYLCAFKKLNDTKSSRATDGEDYELGI